MMTHEEIEAAIKRLSELEEKKSYLARDVMRALIGRDFPDLYGNIGTLKALLRQADPDAHMLLPVDADGEPIHVGDVLYEEGDEPFEVHAFKVCEMMPSKTNGWELFGGYGDGFSAYDPATCRHYHKPTIESVLTEYAKKLLAWHNDSDPSDSADDELALVAEYADRLREVMADDDAR